MLRTIAIVDDAFMLDKLEGNISLDTQTTIDTVIHHKLSMNVLSNFQRPVSFFCSNIPFVYAGDYFSHCLLFWRCFTALSGKQQAKAVRDVLQGSLACLSSVCYRVIDICWNHNHQACYNTEPLDVLL